MVGYFWLSTKKCTCLVVYFVSSWAAIVMNVACCYCQTYYLLWLHIISIGELGIGKNWSLIVQIIGMIQVLYLPEYLQYIASPSWKFTYRDFYRTCYCKKLVFLSVLPQSPFEVLLLFSSAATVWNDHFWIIRYVTMKDPRVEFCGYSVPHPSEDKINFRIQTNGSCSAEDALRTGLMNLQSAAEVMLKTFDKAVEKYETEHSVETMDQS